MKEKYKKTFGEEEVDVFLYANEIQDKSVKEYLLDILFGISENEEKINNLIITNLKENWTIDRISKINLSIIKIAIYEMVYNKLPYKVVINEAVELAKKYSEEQGGAFVNGILASVVKEENLSGE